ncbi:hypothetical protein [Nitrospira sp. BLG_1]|uniref:hypothetical protein n=1 Tax=Nitrospira sp. BLG_1 TaxID=3395883 RepID=UPI0039BC3769
MGKSLIDTDNAKAVAPRKKRERIQIMEVKSREEWFKLSRDQFGRPVWFVRVEVTGLRPRRFGPFSTKHKGLLFLDHLLNGVVDGMVDASNDLERYQVRRRCFGARAGHYPITEDELCSQWSR